MDLSKVKNYIQSKINDFSASVQRAAPQVAQNYMSAYTKAAPYIPFAPKISTPQQIQQNYQNIQANPVVKNIIKPYVQNNVVNPILKEAPQAFAKIPTNIQNRQYGQAAGNLAQGVFSGVRGGINFVDPLAGLAWSGYEGLKAQAASRNKGESIPQSLEAMRQGFVGQKFTGVGTALKPNTILEKPLNAAEIAIPLAHMGYNLVKSVKSVADFARLTPEQKLAYQEAYSELKIKPTTNAPTSMLIAHEGVDRKTVDIYKAKILRGEHINPIIVVREGEKFGVEDGKHRLQAYKELGIKEVPIIFKGGHEYQRLMTAESRIKLPEDKFIKGLEKDKIKQTSIAEANQRAKELMGEPPYMPPSELKRQVSQAQGKAETQPGVFNKIFGKWIGKRDAATTIGMKEGMSVPNTEGVTVPELANVIENKARGTAKVNAVVNPFRQKTEALFKKAQSYGIDLGKIENYVPHIWQEDPATVAEMYRTASKQFGFSKSRTVPTIEEGLKMGLTPKFSDPRQLIAEYVKKLEQTKANIEFIKELKDQGLITQKRMPGMEPITGVGFQSPSIRIGENTIREGNYYAPANIARTINRVFNPEDYGVLGRGLGITSKISKTMQEAGLSGGAPASPMNAFGVAQVIKETTAGRPIAGAKAFIRSFSDRASRNYFEENANQIIKMQERNIPVSTNFTIDNIAGNNVRGNIVGAIKNVLKGQFKEAGGNLGEIWNKSMNDPTFKRFMPQLQVQYFNDIEKAALKQGRSAPEAADIAAQAVKNFYGVTGSDATALGKNIHDPLAEKFLSTFTFAPKFRESMVNFWLNNVKALRNPLALENRANSTFIVGAIATYLGMDYLNYKMNGKHMNQNPKGTEDKLLIPDGKGNYIGVPFLSSIATVPRALYREGKSLITGDIKTAMRDFEQSFSSMAFKPLADVTSNQDYFGNQIYDENATPAEKFKAQGRYLVSQYMTHPYLKELSDPRYSKSPAYQRLSRAMEFPFRFYTQASLNTKEYFAAKDAALGGLSGQEKSAFDSIPKADTNDPNTRILKYQIYLTYPKVFEAKQKIELETAAKTNKSIDPLYLVNYDTAKKYMRYESLPEGSQDRKDLTKANPELIALFDIRNKFFKENPIPGQVQTNTRPMPSDYVQKQMDLKNWKDPQVRAYLDANTAWNNEQRAKLELPPLASYSSGGGGSKFKIYPPKLSFKKAKIIKIAKGKTTKLKTVKIKGLKTAKAPSFKGYKSLKLKAYKPLKLKVPKVKALA